MYNTMAGVTRSLKWKRGAGKRKKEMADTACSFLTAQQQKKVS